MSITLKLLLLITFPQATHLKGKRHTSEEMPLAMGLLGPVVGKFASCLRPQEDRQRVQM